MRGTCSTPASFGGKSVFKNPSAIAMFAFHISCNHVGALFTFPKFAGQLRRVESVLNCLEACCRVSPAVLKEFSGKRVNRDGKPFVIWPSGEGFRCGEHKGGGCYGGGRFVVFAHDVKRFNLFCPTCQKKIFKSGNFSNNPRRMKKKVAGPLIQTFQMQDDSFFTAHGFCSDLLCRTSLSAFC